MASITITFFPTFDLDCVNIDNSTYLKRNKKKHCKYVSFNPLAAAALGEELLVCYMT